MYDTLVTALQTLAGVCDGAVTDDNVGFNGRDTRFGKSLAEQTKQGRTLSQAQQSAAIKMLQTYRNQLKRHGIELPTVMAYMGVQERAGAPERVVEAAQVQSSVATPQRAPARIQAAPAPRLTRVTIGVSQGQYALKFPYDPKLVEKIKTISYRKWDNDHKQWLISPDCDGEMAQALLGCETVWSEEAKDLDAKLAAIRAAAILQAHDIAIPNLTGEPFPFQKAGIHFIDTAGGRAIIGDDMGLGKTIQAIGYLALHPELRPAVIVVPASLKPNWRREIAKWMTTEERVHVINGTKPYDVPGSTIFLINYDILPHWQTWLEMLNPPILIADEAHMVKNQKAKRTKALQSLAKVSARVVLLTGTPIMNRPAELFPLLQAVNPVLWSNFFVFGKRYCNGHQRNIGKKKVWDFSGASNLAELHDKLKTTMIRRLKSQVLTELPPKTRSVVPIEIDLDAYQDFMDETLDELKAAGNQAAQLAIVEYLKQYVVEKKIDQVFEWVDNFLESGEKLILFTVHKMTAAALMERYGDQAVKITGDSSQEDRDNAVQQFQNNPSVTLFVGNIQAAGVGLTLTAASNVAFVELAWRPGDMTQSEDRAHRIGQTSAVTAWYLLAEGTVEETIFDLLEKKRQIVEQVADGQVSDLAFASGDVTKDLIDLLLKEKK